MIVEATVKTLLITGQMKPCLISFRGMKAETFSVLDETTLFYSLMPDKSLKGETCQDRKKSKKHFIVLLCSSADGLEKLNPSVIVKLAKLSCFKTISTLPCKYTDSKNLWMVTKIFVDFLNQSDSRMGFSKRKVLLFLEKCPAHPPDTTVLKNTKVIFFPANCTSRLRPLDVGVIHVTKDKYQKTLIQKSIAAIDRKQN
jgi:hypothetical protein